MERPVSLRLAGSVAEITRFQRLGKRRLFGTSACERDELCMMYGAAYWRERLGRSAAEDIFRFQFWLGESLLAEAEDWLECLCAPCETAPPHRKVSHSGNARAKEELAPEAIQAPSKAAEAENHDIGEIVTAAQRTLTLALQAAFDAGRDQAAAELRRRTAAIFASFAAGDFGRQRHPSQAAASLVGPSPDSDQE